MLLLDGTKACLHIRISGGKFILYSTTDLSLYEEMDICSDHNPSVASITGNAKGMIPRLSFFIVKPMKDNGYFNKPS